MESIMSLKELRMSQGFNQQVKRKAIFLDRDGVINVEKNYIYKQKDFNFIEGVFDAVQYFKKLGYLVIVITNQSGIGRNYYSVEDFHKLNNWMLNEFDRNQAALDCVYFCCHRPDENCSCRKPKPGMILNAISDFNIDIKQCWLIGDKESDIGTGRRAGMKNLILVRSGHSIDESNTEASYIVDSVYDTIRIILPDKVSSLI